MSMQLVRSVVVPTNVVDSYCESSFSSHILEWAQSFERDLRSDRRPKKKKQNKKIQHFHLRLLNWSSLHKLHKTPIHTRRVEYDDKKRIAKHLHGKR